MPEVLNNYTATLFLTETPQLISIAISKTMYAAKENTPTYINAHHGYGTTACTSEYTGSDGSQ